jgi:hypothetical protein
MSTRCSDRPAETAGTSAIPTRSTPSTNDVPRPLAEEALSKERDESNTAYHDPWPIEAWPTVVTRFVLCSEDRFIPPEFMRRVVAARLGIVPDEIAAGHCVALSRPKELADLLIGYTSTRDSA